VAMHGFVPALTSFVGRAMAVDEVSGLLGGSRLVTVTGPGGVGKSRLAAEVAGRAADQYADGVWLVELAAVEQPALVPAAVAAVLGVRELPGVPVAASLARVLARQELLLVLDNCEHVVGAAAQLCAVLLHGADDVRVLATSREPLRVAGEARYRLPPLQMRDPDEPDAGESDAVVLFADRVRQVDSHFTLDRESGPSAARLVARLDGIPLAIELAAARADSLGLAQLADRIGDRLGLLVTGDRTAPARQQSLAATVQWSYWLLGQREQRVFRLASVFPGPFTLEAVEAVAGPGAGVLALSLVDCSLLGLPQSGADGTTRYAMLETCAPTARRAWRRAENGPGQMRRWLGTLCRSPSTPRPACGPAPGRSPPRADWTLRTPLSTRA
jgi:predicted ATPase